MRAQRFLVGCVTGSAVAVALNLVPYAFTYRAYHYDGFEVVGFPLIFRRIGGVAYTEQFLVSALLINVVFALALALLAGWIAIKLPRRTHGFPLDPVT